MQEDRSPHRIIQSRFDVKTWLARRPSCDEARPRLCPVCEAAAHGVEGLGLWGHGGLWRQMRGPLEANGEPLCIAVEARRYQCQQCQAVLVVVPRGMLRRRFYSAQAIALGCALWGVLGLCATEVRRRTSSWPGGDLGWPQLCRWLRAVRQGELFGAVGAIPAGWTLRQVAERVAHVAAAYAVEVCGGTLVERAFDGGARM